MRREVETLGNKIKSLCIEVCIMFKKLCKYLEMNHEGLRKVLRM
jgi:hypothetical protein